MHLAEFGSRCAADMDHAGELSVNPGDVSALAEAAADVCNPADLIGPYAFQLTGLTDISGAPKPAVSLGRIAFDGHGGLTGTASATFEDCFWGTR